jgi:predicted NACHT family NTPase
MQDVYCFQEYFAAQHLAKGFASNQTSLAYIEACQTLKEHKYNPRYENVWCFVSGILASQKEISIASS